MDGVLKPFKGGLEMREPALQAFDAPSQAAVDSAWPKPAQPAYALYQAT